MGGIRIIKERKKEAIVLPFFCFPFPSVLVEPFLLFFLCKQLAKFEKQQQRKEKTRIKVPSESSRERNVPRSKNDPSASSGAEGDVSSEREP